MCYSALSRYILHFCCLFYLKNKSIAYYLKYIRTTTCEYLCFFQHKCNQHLTPSSFFTETFFSFMHILERKSNKTNLYRTNIIHTYNKPQSQHKPLCFFCFSNSFYFAIHLYINFFLFPYMCEHYIFSHIFFFAFLFFVNQQTQ